MSQDPEPTGTVRRPVLNGLVALFAVALTVGVIMAGLALVATNVLGLGSDADASAGASGEGPSMYVPRPERTTPTSGPLITLDTAGPDTSSTAGEGDEEESEDADESESADDETEKAKKDKGISLSAGQTSVENFGRIDLTGVYPGGEGAVLQVQRFQDGAWANFDATIPVSGGTFSTYVQTGVSGVNRFRVVDPSTNKASNEVRVTVE